MQIVVDDLVLDERTKLLVDRVLKDFAPPGVPDLEFDQVSVVRELPLVDLARMPLEHRGFVPGSSGGDIRWRLDGTFRGVEVAVVDDNTRGPLVLVSTRREMDAETLGGEAAKALSKACQLLERRVLRSYATAQAAKGDVIVLNLSSRLHGAYRFHKWHGQGLIDGNGHDKVRELLVRQACAAADVDQATRWFLASNVGFCVTAMTSAWFSWLEHVLVLALPFGSWEPEDDGASIQQVIDSGWGEKWKRVVGHEHPEAKQTYDALRRVAEEYRNRDAHGGFGKREAAFLVHTPVGLLPTQLSSGVAHILGSALPSSFDPLGEVAEVFAAAEDFLRTGSCRRAMQWIDAGLDVAFDHAHRQAVKGEMAQSDDAFEQALERWSDVLDRANNFEF